MNGFTFVETGQTTFGKLSHKYAELQFGKYCVLSLAEIFCSCFRFNHVLFYVHIYEINIFVSKQADCCLKKFSEKSVLPVKAILVFKCVFRTINIHFITIFRLNNIRKYQKQKNAFP